MMLTEKKGRENEAIFPTLFRKRKGGKKEEKDSPARSLGKRRKKGLVIPSFSSRIKGKEREKEGERKKENCRWVTGVLRGKRGEKQAVW